MSRNLLIGLLAGTGVVAFVPQAMAQFGPGAERWKAPELNSRRETTTGRDVDRRLYGPGHAHWGSASRKKGGTSGATTKSKHDASMPAIQNTR